MQFLKQIEGSNFILLLIMFFAGAGCKSEISKPEPVDIDSCWFSETPQNMDFLNTEYDDYNMNVQYLGQELDLYYSTNKGSLGKEFDIVGRRLEVGVNLDNGLFTFNVSPSEPTYAWKLLPKINTPADEVGPFSFYSDSVIGPSTRWYFFYASNESGNFEIRFAYTVVGDWEGTDAEKQIFGPYDATVLTYDRDDYYPTIDAGHSRLYFSSNRLKHFDIYFTELEQGDLVAQLQEGNLEVRRGISLISYSNDKCPYIKGNLMVFASDRDKGFGGYDLWYSVYEKGEWGEPQNFGPEINTEYDESRPAIEYFESSNNDLMIFSSNRPGGSGGFDLYYVGIPKMIRD